MPIPMISGRWISDPSYPDDAGPTSGTCRMEDVCLVVPRGLSIPVVYNCGGYESVETLRELEGVVDLGKGLYRLAGL